MITLNETPVRTCNKFGINSANVELKDKMCVRHIFDGLILKSTLDEECISDNIQGDVSFKHGLNNELNEDIINNANKKINIDMTSKKLEKVDLTFNFDGDDMYLKCLFNVNSKKDSKGNLVVTFDSMSDKPSANISYLKFVLEENANLNVVILNKLNGESLNTLAIDAEQGANSKLNITIVDFGAKTSVINCYSNLSGDGAKNNLNSIYIAKNQKFIDLNYITDILGKKCGSNINSKGALMDSAKKHFKGTISFEKGAKKSKGNEQEFSYLLSKDVSCLSLPMLLCKEEDVEGEHSASSGKIDKNLLFYLESRGLSEKDATKMIIKASFNSLLNNIEDDSFKDMIIDEIDRKV